MLPLLICQRQAAVILKITPFDNALFTARSPFSAIVMFILVYQKGKLQPRPMVQVNLTDMRKIKIDFALFKAL